MGAIGMHPWELWEYSFQEYLWRREGYYKEQKRILRQHWEHARLQSYYSIVYDANLSQTVRKKKLDKLIPDVYDETAIVEKDADWYQKQREHARKVTANLKKRAGIVPKKKNGK